ncbi:hypothetical protein WOLCODRAFT_154244 [Wolfiporia cocos MD-104 SS10]|uniref:Uncharacterized protein n=1 Tax=Wolfiporia cocos (strain MD-104) TaxID=742152 RepID=A0A2H3JPW8_WOLCO|nr:hypothetical protein WOLCODRAFT_154244 [Wolfiporia cocos MD-104 SS10]
MTFAFIISCPSGKHDAIQHARSELPANGLNPRKSGGPDILDAFSAQSGPTIEIVSGEIITNEWFDDDKAK